MDKVIKEAEKKFGEVDQIRKHKNGGFVLMILRSEPANELFPYMTIRAIVAPSNNVDFNWGCYDMDEADAHTDFLTR